MKKTTWIGIALFCTAAVMAGPHRPHHHHDNGVRLAADIVNLVGASLNTANALVNPAPVVVTQPVVYQQPVVVTQPVVCQVPPAVPRPVIYRTPPPPPAPRHHHRMAPPPRPHHRGRR